MIDAAAELTEIDDWWICLEQFVVPPPTTPADLLKQRTPDRAQRQVPDGTYAAGHALGLLGSVQAR